MSGSRGERADSAITILRRSRRDTPVTEVTRAVASFPVASVQPLLRLDFRLDFALERHTDDQAALCTDLSRRDSFLLIQVRRLFGHTMDKNLNHCDDVVSEVTGTAAAGCWGAAPSKR